VKKEVLNDKLSRKVISGEKITIAQIFLAKDGMVPPHDHNHEQISFALAVALRFEAEGREIGVVPHLSTFGKAMGNGFAISALAGKRAIMRLGGLDHHQPRVLLLSTTHVAETHALPASLEILRIYRERNVVEVFCKQGEGLRALVNQSIAGDCVPSQVPSQAWSKRFPAKYSCTIATTGYRCHKYRERYERRKGEE
jgi:hypothetical protein